MTAVHTANAALKILQLSTADAAGGAERSALQLHEQFDALGHHTWLAVGRRGPQAASSRISVIDNDRQRNALVRLCDRLIARADRNRHALRGLGRAARGARLLAEPVRSLRRAIGHEDFDFPASHSILDSAPWTADIVHCHNLHGGYFDLRALPWLSAQVPTVVNLRDAWMLTGHCAHGIDCERWRIGCGQCPDLNLYPSISRDATAYNWRRKRDIYARSKVYVTAPSQWLLDQVIDSMLAPAVRDARVIPNGVDTQVFKVADRAVAREALGIEPRARVLMVAANGIRNNPWKDWAGLRRAIERVATPAQAAPLLVLAVGVARGAGKSGDADAGSDERIGNAQVRFVPFVDDSAQMARWYQASDVYVHAARVESFANVLLEARACGIPVVSTAVGGIVEHVRSLDCPWSAPGVTPVARQHAFGVLTAPGDDEAMSRAISMLLDDEALRADLSRAGSAQALREGSLALQAQRFVDWYREILAHPPVGGRP